MLNLKLVFSNWWNFFQSGFYFDFLIKKIVTLTVYNLFIYTATYFGEKYLIEYLTKKIFENQVFAFNKIINFKNYNYVWFFFQVFSFLLIILFFIFLTL